MRSRSTILVIQTHVLSQSKNGVFFETRVRTDCTQRDCSYYFTRAGKHLSSSNTLQSPFLRERFRKRKEPFIPRVNAGGLLALIL